MRVMSSGDRTAVEDGSTDNDKRSLCHKELEGRGQYDHNSRPSSSQ